MIQHSQVCRPFIALCASGGYVTSYYTCEYLLNRARIKYVQVSLIIGEVHYFYFLYNATVLLSWKPWGCIEAIKLHTMPAVVLLWPGSILTKHQGTWREQQLMPGTWGMSMSSPELCWEPTSWQAVSQSMFRPTEMSWIPRGCGGCAYAMAPHQAAHCLFLVLAAGPLMEHANHWGAGCKNLEE